MNAMAAAECQHVIIHDHEVDEGLLGTKVWKHLFLKRQFCGLSGSSTHSTLAGKSGVSSSDWERPFSGSGLSARGEVGSMSVIFQCGRGGGWRYPS